MLRMMMTTLVVAGMASAAHAEGSFVDRFKAQCKEMGEVIYCDCVLKKLDEEVYLDSYDDWTEDEISEDEDFNKASEACFSLLGSEG